MEVFDNSDLHGRFIASVGTYANLVKQAKSK